MNDNLVLNTGLENVVNSGQQLIISAFHQGSEVVGKTIPISYGSLVKNQQKVHNVELFQNYKKIGNLKFSSQFHINIPKPLNPNLNKNCYLQLKIEECDFLGDGNTMENLDHFV